MAITNGTSEYSYLKNGGANGTRTPDPLLAKPLIGLMRLD